MILGVLQLDFSIPHALSLKDKRRAITSVMDRIAHGFNASVAETASQDTLRRGVLSVAMVGSDHAYVEGALHKIVDLARNAADANLDDFRIDFV